MSARGSIAVDPLDRHAHLVPRLCEEFLREWPAWCGSVTRARLEACFASAPDGGLPIVFVAHDHGLPLGTISLRPWFAAHEGNDMAWMRKLVSGTNFENWCQVRISDSSASRRSAPKFVPDTNFQETK